MSARAIGMADPGQIRSCRSGLPHVGSSAESRTPRAIPVCLESATDRDRGSLAAPPLPHHRTYGSVNRSRGRALRAIATELVRRSAWISVNAQVRFWRISSVRPEHLHRIVIIEGPGFTRNATASLRWPHIS
jgi:hypothetical protein